ncbi:rhodanese domain-containing protein CG4456-like isoform X2 [Artemia franciscana]
MGNTLNKSKKKDKMGQQNSGVTFDDVKAGIENKNVTVIDVRNPEELTNTGKIPGAINVPLPSIKSAFELSDSEFKERFGINKPTTEDNSVIVHCDNSVIVHCLTGKRAASAIEILKGLGYLNLKLYSGSFSDWQKNNGPIEKL